MWSTPLLPGKYAFNTYAGRVVAVPTTNFILKWNRREMGSHRFDENLSEVSLITRDAFEPSLPLSVVVHIDYRKAPLVVQRFGDIKRLVEQTLDPMVAAHFKNIGQTRTLIELLQDRSAIQERSGKEMREKFAHYNLQLEEVLIGTPTSSGNDKHIDTILAQLRQRQIAEEQVETYGRQQKAAVAERELNEAHARAQQQRSLTESEAGITIQKTTAARSINARCSKQRRSERSQRQKQTRPRAWASRKRSRSKSKCARTEVRGTRSQSECSLGSQRRFSTRAWKWFRACSSEVAEEEPRWQECKDRCSRRSSRCSCPTAWTRALHRRRQPRKPRGSRS